MLLATSQPPNVDILAKRLSLTALVVSKFRRVRDGSNGGILRTVSTASSNERYLARQAMKK
jgi:hypothetical protein